MRIGLPIGLSLLCACVAFYDPSYDPPDVSTGDVGGGDAVDAGFSIVAVDPCRTESATVCTSDGAARVFCRGGAPELQVCPGGCADGVCLPECAVEGANYCSPERDEIRTCIRRNVSWERTGPCPDASCLGGRCLERFAACDPSGGIVARCDERDENLLLLCDPTAGAVEVEIDCGNEPCVTLWVDADRDGFGDPATGLAACGGPTGRPPLPLVENGRDCDDEDDTINPLVQEIVGDGIDQDCDGIEICYLDQDQDRHADSSGARGTSDDGGCRREDGLAAAEVPRDDCNDDDADVHGAAEEIVANGRDENCDGAETCYADADGDGVPADRTVRGSIACDQEGESLTPDGPFDCDDGTAASTPGGEEIPSDGIDGDCDGFELCLTDRDGDDAHAGVAPVASLDHTCAEFGSPPADAALDCDDTDGRVVRCFEGADWVVIPAGTFVMGSPESEEGRNNAAGIETQRETTLTRSLAVSRYEVSQGEWLAAFGENPSQAFLCGEDCPVERVTWFDALAYANLLSISAGLEECYRPSACTGVPGRGLQCDEVTFIGFGCDGYRLPTEAEWEFAARAGTSSAFPNGDIQHTGTSPLDENLNRIGWYGGNADATQPRGGLAPNPWGLYDTAGNVAEWTFDAFAPYDPEDDVNPNRPGAASSQRVVRGGAFDRPANACRSAARTFESPSLPRNWIGLRLVRTLPVGAR